jgi:hypothetical protein
LRNCIGTSMSKLCFIDLGSIVSGDCWLIWYDGSADLAVNSLSGAQFSPNSTKKGSTRELAVSHPHTLTYYTVSLLF